ncbi:peptidase S58 [Kordiimonas sediminis]|uniref:Peptidase S58 n=1 Tax=Kordiimonas sediminis TaxID=1735581 RepID=A0A919E2C1_9PROT|nr:P1 family peptidase [Kordiimonas sediminis]GHF12425.1 peptidase S58 [Kordiimonas sediminis]
MHITAKPGPSDSFTDIRGIRVGQAACRTAKTGVTVILPDAPVAMGVDVRGGGPGTRDTDALNPECLVEKVHGLVLSGGSVFGLAAADGATSFLSEKGIGLPLGPHAVPVVPSAILFDLMNGGDKAWGDTPPYRQLGIDAAKAATHDPVASGSVGAGYGALCGGEAGGLGTASLQTDDGICVAALVAVNSFGPRTDIAGGEAVEHGHVSLPKLGFIGANTTIAAIATNLDLDKAACKRLAIMGHDGLARAIRPLHTPFDGDTVFALSSGAKKLDGDKAKTLAVVGTLAADCLAIAVKRAVENADR